MTSWRSHYYCVVIALLLGISSVLMWPGDILAVQISIDGTVIGDRVGAGAGQDLNNGQHIIQFDSDDPTRGFAVPGYRVKGIVTADFANAGTLVPPVTHRLTLLDLVIDRKAGAIDHLFAIDFRHTFSDPAAPVAAQDGIKGVFDNTVHPAVIGGTSIRQFEGRINAEVIGRVANINAPLVSPSGGNNVAPFDHHDGPVQKANGPPWALQGALRIEFLEAMATDGSGLGTGDRISLGSDIGIAPTPEPTTLLLFGTTAAGLGLARWRQRRRKQRADL
jgi:hypothetical protein